MTQNEQLLVTKRLLEACRQGRGELSLVLSKAQNEISFLCAHLAEAHVLLRESLDELDKGPSTFSKAALRNRIHAALSASVEPSAPVERDERAEFESWLSSSDSPRAPSEARCQACKPTLENKDIKNHNGKKLLVQHILDNDKGLSDSSH